MTSKHYKELLKAMEIIDEYIFLLKIVLLLIWRWQSMMEKVYGEDGKKSQETVNL
ncbi:hypothetical protein YC2023_023339 [Brassica napus]